MVIWEFLLERKCPACGYPLYETQVGLRCPIHTNIFFPTSKISTEEVTEVKKSPPPEVKNFPQSLIAKLSEYNIYPEDLPFFEKFLYKKGGGTVYDFLQADSSVKKLLVKEFRDWRAGKDVFFMY